MCGKEGRGESKERKEGRKEGRKGGGKGRVSIIGERRKGILIF